MRCIPHSPVYRLKQTPQISGTGKNLVACCVGNRIPKRILADKGGAWSAHAGMHSCWFSLLFRDPSETQEGGPEILRSPS